MHEASSERLSYLSKSPGIGGAIKQSPDDFIVEEITETGDILEFNKHFQKPSQSSGQFLHFVLQKKGWTTADALRAIAQRLHISYKRLNAAGNKDRVASTTQLISAFAVKKEQLCSLSLKDIHINGCWQAKKKVDMGALLGNRFTIRWNGKGRPYKKVAKIYSEMGGIFPNYFGEQRFGSTRRNTHIVGEFLIKGHLRDAALSFLTASEGERNAEVKAARKQLLETQDFKAALTTYPKFLKMEHLMLNHLAHNPKDYANAFRRLPRSLLLLFIHAFQSYLFNISLSERIAEGEIMKEEGEFYCGENSFKFPDLKKRLPRKTKNSWLAVKIIGYESKLNKREKELLKRLEITQDDFKVRNIPELNVKGTYRTCFAPMKDFSFKDNTFRFCLPAGSYATAALREFLKPTD